MLGGQRGDGTGTLNGHLGPSNTHYLAIDAHKPDASNCPIVLIHGLATNMAFWYAGVANALATSRQVVLFDLRGHGRSAMPPSGYTAAAIAQDLLALLDHFDFERAHIVGHSYGGLIGLEFALQYPERTQSLIVADTRFPSVQRELTARSAPPGELLFVHLTQLGISIPDDCTDFGIELLTQMARLRVLGDPRATSIEHHFIGAQRMLGPRTAKRWLELLDKTDARAQFNYGSALTLRDVETLNRPSCAIYGAQSMTLPSGLALSKALPNCQFEIVPGVGHFFPATRPQEFVKRALPFLENCPAKWIGSTSAHAHAEDRSHHSLNIN
jgi:pimeloyl-ACP methyl ester carboxylesterase